MSYSPYSGDPGTYGTPPQQAHASQPSYGAGGYGPPGYSTGYAAGYGSGGYTWTGTYPPVALPSDLAPLPGASPAQAFRRFFRRYAQFRGCASRSELWWVQAALAVIQVVLSTLLILLNLPFLMALLAWDPAAEPGGPTMAPVATTALVAILVLSVVASLFSLVVLVPTIALGVRRLHDAGYSGLWYLLTLVPGGSIALIILWCMPSQPHRFRPEWG